MNWEQILFNPAHYSIWIAIVVSILFGVVIAFIVNSTKYFPPSDIIAISSSKRPTGEISEDGEVLYDSFTYHMGGGKLFIPFWKDYYVLSAQLMTSSISTQKFLTKDKVHIRADFVVQYHIDFSTPEKIREAFIVFSSLVRHKNQKLESNISKIFETHFEKLFKGTVPEILGKMTLDELFEYREKASTGLLNRVREDFLTTNLVITSLKIETIHIENQAYRETLDKTVNERQRIAFIREKNRSKNEELKSEIEDIRRQKELEEEKFKLESAQIEFNTQIKMKKVEQNKRFKDLHKEEEEYNKAVILTKERAKVEAELIIKQLAKEKELELKQKEQEAILALKRKEKEELLNLKEMEKTKELQLKQKEQEAILALKLKEKKELLSLEEEEKEQELKLKQKEKENLLKLKQMEKETDIKLKEEEKQKNLELEKKEREQSLVLTEKEKELENRMNRIKNEIKVKNIKEIKEALKDINGFTSIFIILEQNPTLVEQIFGKGGISEIVKNMTQHLSNIDNITITELGSAQEVSSLERFALLVPTLISQITKSVNKNELSKFLTDLGLDKKSMEDLKNSKNFRNIIKNIKNSNTMQSHRKEKEQKEFNKNKQNSPNMRE